MHPCLLLLITKRRSRVGIGIFKLHIMFERRGYCCNPTLRQVGGWDPLGFLKMQSSILGVKTPRLEVFFISSERSWSVDVENGLACAILTSRAQVMVKRRVGNRLDPGVCRWSATHRWKALEENYKFASDLVSIEGLSWELWALKVPKVQTGTFSRLLLGSLGTKNHLDACVMERRREYYMGEGGGFPRVRAVVNQVSPCCWWLVLAPRCSRMWTNHFVVGLMHVRVSE
jgi:hypothetical protein